MPRKPRHFLAHVPCHIISRGNNHNACYFVGAGYLFYLECLNDADLRHVQAMLGHTSISPLKYISMSVVKIKERYLHQLMK